MMHLFAPQSSQKIDCSESSLPAIDASGGTSWKREALNPSTNAWSTSHGLSWPYLLCLSSTSIHRNRIGLSRLLILRLRSTPATVPASIFFREDSNQQFAVFLSTGSMLPGTWSL